MSEISETQNLNAYYTTNAKIERPKHVVVSGPDNIPRVHVYNDIDANNRLNNINHDIYVDSQKIPKAPKKKKFLGIF